MDFAYNKVSRVESAEPRESETRSNGRIGVGNPTPMNDR